MLPGCGPAARRTAGSGSGFCAGEGAKTHSAEMTPVTPKAHSEQRCCHSATSARENTSRIHPLGTDAGEPNQEAPPGVRSTTP